MKVLCFYQTTHAKLANINPLLKSSFLYKVITIITTELHSCKLTYYEAFKCEKCPKSLARPVSHKLH